LEFFPKNVLNCDSDLQAAATPPLFVYKLKVFARLDSVDFVKSGGVFEFASFVADGGPVYCVGAPAVAENIMPHLTSESAGGAPDVTPVF